jgi:hypothetical protein
MAYPKVTDRMIAAGKKLIEDLAKKHVKMTLVCWFYSDDDEWWFIIASPKADTNPREAIQDLQMVWDEKRHPSLSEIKIYGKIPENSSISLLRKCSIIPLLRIRIDSMFIKSSV